MSTWRWMRDYIGVPAIAAVLAVTAASALLAILIAPRLIPARQQAEANVSLTSVTGPRASYELATFVADFQAALASNRVKTAAAHAAGVRQPGVDADLTSERLGDATAVRVRFVAGSTSGAEAGVRAATREGLAVLVSDAKRRSDLELAAAVSHQQKVLKALGKDETAASGGIPKEYRERSRDVLLQRAAEGVSDATGQSVLVRTETASLGAAVRGQHVEVVALPTTSAQVRIALAASATTFLLALGGVLLFRRPSLAALWASAKPSGGSAPGSREDVSTSVRHASPN